jgi:hypothetical protein
MEGLVSKFLGVGDGVADVDVVEEDIALHCPDFKTDCTHRLQVGGSLIFKIFWVLDLSRGPDALVGRIIYSEGKQKYDIDIDIFTDIRSCPFTLVGGVLIQQFSIYFTQNSESKHTLISGFSHFPQPETSSHFGLGTVGATQSPSSSSSQSSGFSASGSGMVLGSSTNQSSGIVASSSTISNGASYDIS